MRGMAAGEATVSQANTKEFEDGYERTFGKDRRPQRGKWVMDPKTGKLVDASTHVSEARALDAPIMAGRFYEGCVATDGTDLGSRQRHQQYMREHNLTIDSDYKETYKREADARARFYTEGNRSEADRKQRREDVARTVYELSRKEHRRG